MAAAFEDLQIAHIFVIHCYVCQVIRKHEEYAFKTFVHDASSKRILQNSGREEQ